MKAEELRHGAKLAETSCGRESLPDWHQLLAAFRGEVGWSPGDHLIACWAKAFANLHRERHLSSQRTIEIDCRRAQVVTLVDQWTERYVIAPRRRLQPTRPVGAALDEIAAAYVAAEYCLMAAEDVAGDTVHAAWSRVAELACRWNDPVAHNPGPWHPSGAEGQE